ncbi:hypothetical protein KIN20_020194 [Parelaphostrongylus tenuis]|uniref:Uncharacterized protein n=1 Tax=Parelaphostrongylus tenuis TaxID=148309 RepID=A0AAD5MM38_PARTN|nr:hypothetical protein KIN20_020194 [Parelaphostrongylus tenuis]
MINTTTGNVISGATCEKRDEIDGHTELPDFGQVNGLQICQKAYTHLILLTKAVEITKNMVCSIALITSNMSTLKNKVKKTVTNYTQDKTLIGYGQPPKNWSSIKSSRPAFTDIFNDRATGIRSQIKFEDLRECGFEETFPMSKIPIAYM